MCTVIGFIINFDKVVIFNAEDGIIIHNDTYLDIDQKNEPNYMVYHVLNPRYLKLES